MDVVETYTTRGYRIERQWQVGRHAVTTAIDTRADPDMSSARAAWWQSFLRGAPVDGPCASSRLRIADLFSGVGGLTLGFSEAARALGVAVHAAAAVDLDEAALAVYRANFSAHTIINDNVANLVDFHISGRAASAVFAYPPEVIHESLTPYVGNIDVVLAGPPCQGHSNLNNRTRRDDPRNHLYLTAIALAVALDARAILVENVPEVSSARSEVAQTAQSILRSVGFESVDFANLTLERLGGAQTRRRAFLCAVRGSSTVPIRLARIAKQLASAPMPLRWAIGDLLDAKPTDVMNSTPAMSDENWSRVQYLFDHDLYDLPNSLRPACHREGTTYRSVYGRLRWDHPAGTITSGFLTMGRGRFIHPLRKRPLTPHEAARVQCFPDTFRWVPEAAPEPNRTLITKWLGDAVPCILAYAASLPIVCSLVAQGAGHPRP